MVYTCVLYLTVYLVPPIRSGLAPLFDIVYILNCLLVRAYAKPAGMAHFGEVFDIVSGALTNNSRMCNNLGEIPAPTVQGTNAKQRRLSRPNSKEETRRKKRGRRKRKRLEGKMMSKRQKRSNLVDQVTKQIDRTRDNEIRQSKIDAEENRKKAVYFWKKWKEEKMKKNSISS